MQNDEMERLTFEVLCKVASYLTDDELALLCWHAGMDSQMFRRTAAMQSEKSVQAPSGGQPQESASAAA